MANTQRDPKKEAFWRDAVRRQARSGLSVREFCRKHGLSEPSFYERRRAYRERDDRRPAASPAFVPLIVRAADASGIRDRHRDRAARRAAPAAPGLDVGRAGRRAGPGPRSRGGHGVIASNLNSDGVRVWVAVESVDMGPEKGLKRGRS